jgi:predicted dehydrogenase
VIRSCAVLGCGSIGLRHLRNLRALGVGSIRAIDPDPAQLDQARAAGAEPAASLEDAGRPEVVLVCTPPAAHIDGIRAALAVGAHVFVEKPIAARLDGVADVIAEAERARRVLWVGYNLRFEPGLVAVKRHLDDGAIGRLLSIRAEFGQYLPDWRPDRDYRTGYNARASEGGGILLDASHEIDHVRWLGGEPVRVQAMVAKLSDLEIDTEDTALLTIALASGALASIALDSVQRAYSRSCRLVGTEGTLVWEFGGPVRLYSAATRAWTDVSPSEWPDMYVEEIRAFLQSVARGTAPLVSGADGARVLAVVEAARRAAETGRETTVA